MRRTARSGYPRLTATAALSPWATLPVAAPGAAGVGAVVSDATGAVPGPVGRGTTVSGGTRTVEGANVDDMVVLGSVTHSNAWKGTATSFSPMPRKPPTPITTASAAPSRLTSTSRTSPILALSAP